MTSLSNTPAIEKKWYVLRDLKRPIAKERAWQTLSERENMEVFTPKRWTLCMENGKRTPKEVAVIPDLLFVHETRDALDPVVERTSTLQYRFRKGGARNEPIVVPDGDMERFIRVVKSTDSPQYYTMQEVTPDMHRRRIRIVGGPLNGYEGYLLTTRGSRKKRLLVEIPDLIAASVEVNPEFIQILHSSLKSTDTP